MNRLFFILPTIVLSTVMSARTIMVGKDQPVTSIQKAIALAKDKDTILVKAGIYKEGNIVINKNIVLIGYGFPVVDGENKHEIFTVITCGCTSVQQLSKRFKGGGRNCASCYRRINGAIRYSIFCSRYRPPQPITFFTILTRAKPG